MSFNKIRVLLLGFALFLCACGNSAVNEHTDAAQAAAETEKTTQADSVFLKDDAETLEFSWSFDPLKVISFDADYMDISMDKDSLEVTEEDRDSEINYLLSSNLEYKEVTDRGALDGDLVNIDFTGTMDDTVIYQENNYNLQLGSGVLTDLETNLEGNKAGDSVSLDIQYPEDYGDEELNGKTVHFDVKINKVSVPYAPEYNDEFVAAHTEYDTVKEYEDSLNDSIVNERKENTISNWLDAHSSLAECPDELYARYEKELVDWYQNVADYYKLSFDEILTNMGYKSKEEFLSSEDTKSMILGNIRTDYSYRYIVADQKLSFTVGQLKEFAEAFAKQNGYGSTDEMMMVSSEDEILQYYVKQEVSDFLKDHMKAE